MEGTKLLNFANKLEDENKDKGYKWLYDKLRYQIIKNQNQAINYTRCCESVKDKYTHTFEVDLNSEKRKEQYNKHIEQIHNAPCKVYLYDGDKYIELKP
jgi:hypothetical protein